MKPLVALAGAALLVIVLEGCATTPAEQTERLLIRNGFKAVPATTPAQRERLASLPPAKVSLIKRQGHHYYVYPDATRNMLYVGSKAAYQAYQMAVQDQSLAQDARLARDVRDQSVINEDQLEMSGAVPSVEEVWEGWPQ
ncbi:MAG TPA: hypothetical protein VMU04_16560 [Candidatus Acidoferrum sp.]|nr:hypothetical protein [Candidatus Acidoferrum sp.]